MFFNICFMGLFGNASNGSSLSEPRPAGRCNRPPSGQNVAMSIDDILNFWFDEIDPAQWWKKDEAFDQALRERFSGVHQRAARCELFGWRTSGRGRLAEVIVLDQFSRNMFRGEARAFACDPLALGLGPVDPYAFGYAPLGMTILLSLASVLTWFRGGRDLAVVLLLPIVAFNLQLLESNNLWDYLLDPILLAYAMVQVLKGRNLAKLKLYFFAAKVKN